MKNIKKNIKINWVGFVTICRKEMTRILRIWTQTLIPPAITLTLYFIIFGSLIGPRIGQMDGFTYMQFIVPGLIMMAVITNSYSNTASSFFGTKFQKNFEEMQVSPLSNAAIILGFVFGGVFRGLTIGLIVTGVSLFFSKLHIVNLAISLLVIVLCSILFSLAGLLNGIFATKFDDVGIVPTFILTPLTYFGGVFYSISLLPPTWQTLSVLNPILHMVNVFRYGFLGTSDVSITFAFIIIIAFIITFFTTALVLLNKGIGIRQ